MISLLFLGDICSVLGRKIVEYKLPELIYKYKADFVIANGENATHGRGLSFKHYTELLNSGINCITMGNHYYGVEDILKRNELYTNMVRPLNLPDKVPGMGSKVFFVKGIEIRVTNLLGVTGISGLMQNNPFEAIDKIIEKSHSQIHFIDFHAEATGEKAALARYVDGRVTCVVGTHTHVQTNDSRILPKGTAFLTDVGACCAYESILGMDAKNVIYRNSTGMPTRFEVPTTGKAQLNACHIVINDNFKAELIETISIIE